MSSIDKNIKSCSIELFKYKLKENMLTPNVSVMKMINLFCKSRILYITISGFCVVSVWFLCVCIDIYIPTLYISIYYLLYFPILKTTCILAFFFTKRNKKNCIALHSKGGRGKEGRVGGWVVGRNGRREEEKCSKYVYGSNIN